MKRYRFIYTICVLLVFINISCSDFLDVEDTNPSYTNEGFYTNENAIREGATGVYSNLYMQVVGELAHTTIFDFYTGLALERNENTTIGAGGGLNADNSDILKFWSQLYTNVARANAFLTGVKPNMDDLSKKSLQYVSEVRVLRAYYYYLLIALWGDVPFYTEPPTSDQYEVEKTSRVKILDFIINECNEATEYLDWIAMDRGRVDKSFAYGLINRMALLGGSLDFGGKSTEYFKIAAEAASKVIGKRLLALNYEDLFVVEGQAKADVRNEMILEMIYNVDGTNVHRNWTGFGFVSRMQGQTSRHPSMLLADTYECIDGKRIDESPLYDVHHPQKNRDPRFKATLWMHGDTATCNNGSLNTVIINAYDDETQQYNYTTGEWEVRNNDDINSAAAWASFTNAGCGYIIAKYSKETSQNISYTSQNVPIMRYAEILLGYAEAKIELGELDQSVYDAINQVRNRVGMPNVSADRIGNIEKMRQLVRRERKVEFAIEGLHLIDMRRWGIGDLENEKPMYGRPIEEIRYKGLSETDIPNFKKSDRHDLNDIPDYESYKEKLKVRDANRYWDSKFELWPIPQQELDRNPKLVQNKGRDFLTYSLLTGGSSLLLPLVTACQKGNKISSSMPIEGGAKVEEMKADIVVVGGGMGGCATALAACRNGMNVILTEETDWIGGQVSQQGVPPDEHKWIESGGATASYRMYRNKIRDFYRYHYHLTEAARNNPYLNPGNGGVSKICHEPMVSVEVLMEMLMPYVSAGKLQILLNHKAQSSDVQGDEVLAVTVRDRQNGELVTLTAPYFVDATECGDLLPLTKTEYVTGSESQEDTKELHAAKQSNPLNNQAFTVCFAMEYIPGEDWTIDKPDNYTFWANYIPNLTPAWPGKLLSMTYPTPSTLKPNHAVCIPDGTPTDAFNFWMYRRIIDQHNFLPGTYQGSTTLVNWPQNDYMLGNIIDVPENEFQKHVDAAKALNLSLLYWLQTEAPRPDGGVGWKGLRLRKNLLGTKDGMAKYPYIRESRRIKAEFRILEEHVGEENRKLISGETTAAAFYDSVGIGYYHIDLHPSCGGDNYIDFNSLRFQIPLGALLPQRVNNLFPACKNIGTTHITNGCYRTHPVEWGIGEAVGLLITYASKKQISARIIRSDKNMLTDFQQWIQKEGVEIAWKKELV